jgi:hypothetical protein
MVYAPQGIEQNVTHNRHETDFNSLLECEKAGNEASELIDLPEHYNSGFSCVPADAIDTKSEKSQSSDSDK